MAVAEGISGLYPQPQAQPSPAQNVFMGNPLEAAQRITSIQGGQIANVGGQIANVTAQLDQNMKQTGFVSSVIGSLDKNSTPDSVNSAFTTIARNTNIPSPILQQWRSQVLNDPKGIVHGLQTLQSIALGGAAGAARVAAPPTPGGQTQETPAGQALYAGTTPVALSPAQHAAGAAYGGAAGGVLGTEATNNTDYRRQVTPLEQAIPALERLGTTGTGPGKDEVNQMKSVAVAFGFAPAKWTGTVKDFDESKKYLTDWVRANGDTSTNDKLAASFSSNASVNISNAAAVDVAKTALAIRRMKYMQLQQFYQTGLSPDQFPQWASKWNAQHDARAFGFDHLTVEQRKNVLKSLPPAKRAMFMFDVRNADDAGVLTNQPAQQ